nr:PREDICTED: uncharacterized protein LOC108953188 [Musa acuminata subsp. malaccensis]
MEMTHLRYSLVGTTLVHVTRHFRGREGLPTWSRYAAPAVDCAAALSLFGGTHPPPTASTLGFDAKHHDSLPRATGKDRQKEGGHLSSKIGVLIHPIISYCESSFRDLCFQRFEECDSPSVAISTEVTVTATTCSTVQATLVPTRFFKFNCTCTAVVTLLIHTAINLL